MIRTVGRLRKGLHYTLGIALFIALWWGGSYLAGPRLLPPPTDVVGYIASRGVVTSFFQQVVLTVGRGLLGFSVAWIVAIPLGFIMGRREAGERVGFFPLLLLQSAPPLFWVTPLVLWLGTRGMVAPVVAFLVSLPLLSVHTMNAIRAVPDYEHDVFTVYAPRPLVIARELYLPHLLPALKANIHLGILVAIKAAMLAEWFAAQDGFGRTIRIHYQFFAMTEFVSWALMFLVVVGGLSFALRTVLSRWLPQYRRTAMLAAGEQPGAPNTTAVTSHGADSVDLVVDRLTFGYQRSVIASRPLFEEVSFTVHHGKPLVVYGESGCGKTTLLKCVADIIKPWSGRVSPTAAKVSLVFQEDALLPHRDVLGNVLLPAMPNVTGGDFESAAQCLQQWGLAGSEAKYPHELSGGMRKRLAMARAWFYDAPILLLDEPFVNLDREARSALWELLFQRLQERSQCALIITHYPEELSRFPVDLLSWTELTR